MLDDNFLGVDDRGEIDRLIPLKEVSEIPHKMLHMNFFDGKSKLSYAGDHEFAQFLFMFHVEQLRESAIQVNTFCNEN